MENKSIDSLVPIGVLGAGNFGTVISNLIAHNRQVYLYARQAEAVKAMAETRMSSGQSLHPNVIPTNDLSVICKKATMLFPVIASTGFADIMERMALMLTPEHIIVHGTKGFDISQAGMGDLLQPNEVNLDSIRTMTEVIKDLTVVVRVGVISGPNLAAEIAGQKPAATVVASRFEEVNNAVINVLRSPRFRVYSSNDVIGVELAGTLKNVFALASGMLSGLGLGENARALLITRGLHEMIQIGKAMGSEAHSFFGLAGIGDLMATCSSEKSRNYKTGFRLSQGDSLEKVLSEMDDTVEGVLTTKIAYSLSIKEQLDTPIINSLYEILFRQRPIAEALDSLMLHNRTKDYDI